MSGNGNGSRTTLGPATKVTIASVVVAIGAVATLVARDASYQSRIERLESRSNRPDPWTGKDMLRFTSELRASNPALVVPTPEHRD